MSDDWLLDFEMFLTLCRDNRLAHRQCFEHWLAYSRLKGHEREETFLVLQRAISNYNSTLHSFLGFFCDKFATQFDSQYRRKSIQCSISILKQGRARASALVTEHEETIEISHGLLIALEDFWQCIVSDNHTDIHLIAGLDYGSDNTVMRDLGAFHSEDRTRFWDYQALIDFIGLMSDGGDSLERLERSKSLVACKVFAKLARKMMAANLDRIELGNLLASLSLMWILSHEDTHIFSGHVEYFKESLGVSCGDISSDDDVMFLDEIAQMSDKATLTRYTHHRILAEMEADSIACFRMVDYVCTNATFEYLPFLHDAVGKFDLRMQEMPGYVLDDKQPRVPELRTMVLLRLCVLAGIGAVMLFHRAIEKNGSTITEYPDLEVRVLNIIQSCVLRMGGKTRVMGNTFFELPYKEGSLSGHEWLQRNPFCMYLLTSLCQDIEVMGWYLFGKHPAVLRDPDLPPDKQLRYSEFERMGESGVYEFVAWALLWSFFYQGGIVGDPDAKDSVVVATAKSRSIRRWLAYNADMYECFSANFRERQERRQPHILWKVDEAYNELKGKSAVCKEILSCVDGGEGGAVGER